MLGVSSHNIFWRPFGRLVAVKEGWCWPAFLYSGLWALYQRLWAVAGGYAAVILACIVIEAGVADFGNMLRPWVTLLGFAAAVVLGARGNELCCDRLRKMGYRRARRMVYAKSAKQAVQTYLALKQKKARKRTRRKGQAAVAAQAVQPGHIQTHSPPSGVPPADQ